MLWDKLNWSRHCSSLRERWKNHVCVSIRTTQGKLIVQWDATIWTNKRNFHIWWLYLCLFCHPFICTFHPITPRLNITLAFMHSTSDSRFSQAHQFFGVWFFSLAFSFWPMRWPMKKSISISVPVKHATSYCIVSYPNTQLISKEDKIGINMLSLHHIKLTFPWWRRTTGKTFLEYITQLPRMFHQHP